MIEYVLQRVIDTERSSSENQQSSLSKSFEKEAQKLWHDALGSKEAWNRCKLMIVGNGRAGKTTLKQSLIGMGFDQGEKSTVGADLSFASRDSKGQWNLTGHDFSAKDMYRKQVAKFVSQRLRPRHLQGTWSKNVDSPAAMSMFRDLEQGFESLELFASQDEKEKTMRFIHDIVLIQVCLGHSKDTSKWIIRPTQAMRQNISKVRGASAILNALGFVEINNESQKSQGRRQKGWKWVKPRVWGGENPVHVIRAAAEACREEIENLVMTRKQAVSDLKRSSSLRNAVSAFEKKLPESTFCVCFSSH